MVHIVTIDHYRFQDRGLEHLRYSEGLHWAGTCSVSCLTIRVSTQRYKHISLQRRQKHKLQLAIGLMLSTKNATTLFLSNKGTGFTTTNLPHTHTVDLTQTWALSSSRVYVWQHKTCARWPSLPCVIWFANRTFRKAFVKWHVVTLLTQMSLCSHQRVQHPRQLRSYHVVEQFGTTVASVLVIQGSNVDHSPKV